MGKSKGRKGKGEKWVQHYSSSHKILLVGEGDFSFSASLAGSFGSATNMVATSHDSQEMLRVKHWSAEAHLEELKRLGCMVLHGVDVHDMNENPILKTMKFHRIVFNFPHAGHILMLKERDQILIERHKDLLSGFFKSAREMLMDGGEVHVAHRNDEPYKLWELEKLANRVGLILKECVEFRKCDYPGYHNKRGGGIKSNKTFPLKECFTFKFSLVDSSNIQDYSGTSAIAFDRQCLNHSKAHDGVCMSVTSHEIGVSNVSPIITSQESTSTSQSMKGKAKKKKFPSKQVRK